RWYRPIWKSWSVFVVRRFSENRIYIDGGAQKIGHSTCFRLRHEWSECLENLGAGEFMLRYAHNGPLITASSYARNVDLTSDYSARSCCGEIKKLATSVRHKHRTGLRPLLESLLRSRALAAIKTDATFHSWHRGPAG